MLNHVHLFVTLWSSPPGSSVHGILQARIQEWVVFLVSRDQTHSFYVSCTGRHIFTTELPGKPREGVRQRLKKKKKICMWPQCPTSTFYVILYT